MVTRSLYGDWLPKLSVYFTPGFKFEVGASLAGSADSLQMALESRVMLFEIYGDRVELRGFVQL